jgi:probable rRNA maturation factor
MSEGGPSRNSAEPAQRAELVADVVRHGSAWGETAVSDATIVLAAHAAFAEVPPSVPAPFEVTILLTDDAEMRALNKTWRGKDKPTNVLSFPAGEAPGDGGALGDIAIAYETAAKEAADARLTLEDHVSHLVVHGLLHLLGFDHLEDDEAQRMENLERKVLASIGIADPYASEGEDAFAEVTP